PPRAGRLPATSPFPPGGAGYTGGQGPLRCERAPAQLVASPQAGIQRSVTGPQERPGDLVSAGKPSSPMKRALRRPWKVASRIARATLVRRRGRSDLERWADGQSLLAPWDSRTIRLAGLVQPGARVLELGAGRMLLREHLPPGCTYI